MALPKEPEKRFCRRFARMPSLSGQPGYIPSTEIREEIRVVFDQVGSPTYATDLAIALLSILEQAEQGQYQPGIYHFSDEGVCSWYDFTVKIISLAGLKARVVPIESKDYPTKAVRPHFSVLNKQKIKSSYGLTIPHWEESLRKCMENMNVIKK